MADAVSLLKQYLPDPEYRIQFSALINDTLDKAEKKIDDKAFNVQTNPKNAMERVRNYQDIYSTLLKMATIGGFGAKEYHYLAWQQALKRLATVTPISGSSPWVQLQRYPGTLLLYALGLGAVAAKRFEFLGSIFATSIYTESGICQAAVQHLLADCLFNDDIEVMQFFNEMAHKMQNDNGPINEWLYEKLRQYTKSLIHNEDEYTYIFHKLEILMALSHLYHSKQIEKILWQPREGKFIDDPKIFNNILQEIKKSIAELQNESPFVKSNIFGHTEQVCMKILENYILYYKNARILPKLDD